ncbi:hypothetical protein ACFOUP_01880 [Belliella kenyensis]|uniref:Lipocalin-like domain-containing protein n=1 Tax=Belliella kenyensis TaxID=1472724 RepID=A0ABV8EIQ1_9BACT|nr:hypothetical protein [Belliella kenyensis]MCH7401055.1 hypothetical protein [Belliella kenyensis]MDN3604053.1 hypothetical protein [Belliella kenyensis]
MKICFGKLRVYVIPFIVIAFTLFGCAEEADPPTPPNSDSPKTENPDNDNSNGNNSDPNADELFLLLQGKWIFGERSRANGRELISKSSDLFNLNSRNKSLNNRYLDYYQAFVEFLSDTTFIYNDPRVLKPRWSAEYGKFQVDADSKKIILEGVGEISIQNADDNKVDFSLKILNDDAEYSLTAVKRELIKDSAKTRMLTKVWALNYENEFGRYIEEVMKEGVEIYNENGEVEFISYPEKILFAFTPSGTILTAHYAKSKFTIFDIFNWRWENESEDNIQTTFDFKDWTYEYELNDLEGIVELTESRMVIRVYYTYDDNEIPELVEWVFDVFEN